MAQHISLNKITYEQGLKLLYLRKEALDHGELPRLSREELQKFDGKYFTNNNPKPGISPPQKIATALDNLKQMASNVSNYYKGLDPSVQSTLLSGALGTGLGAAEGLRRARKGGKNYLGSAFDYGLAGGILGTGAGLAFNPKALDSLYTSGMKKINPTYDETKIKEEAAASEQTANKVTPHLSTPALSPEATALLTGGTVVAGSGIAHGVLNHPTRGLNWGQLPQTIEPVPRSPLIVPSNFEPARPTAGPRPTTAQILKYTTAKSVPTTGGALGLFLTFLNYLHNKNEQQRSQDYVNKVKG
jgi:hypothetical protein